MSSVFFWMPFDDVSEAGGGVETRLGAVAAGGVATGSAGGGLMVGLSAWWVATGLAGVFFLLLRVE